MDNEDIVLDISSKGSGYIDLCPGPTVFGGMIDLGDSGDDEIILSVNDDDDEEDDG
jgi:hypothetical protein